MSQGLRSGVQRLNALATACTVRVGAHAERRLTMPGLACR
jgi:hypothetical protein